MNKLEKKTFSITSITVFVTGTLYFIIKYFFKVETDFGTRPHSLTSSLLHTHIILVPILVGFFGYFLKLHVIPMLKSKKTIKRKSGIAILCTLIIMVISGYLLQIGLDPITSNSIAWIHIIISFLWIIIYLYHLKQRIN
jgi:hypothetical protein